ncbi:hypothetical protein [Alkalimarinus sediminis]|uniref:Uncharacterized protein n=1 Tax=Alkalimarinus sediminis TaxID=1632866 RepID=A0A9E8HI23_9ALTE|nr:hypothetical protein [Alkalimarinus sediminis]UZW73737.1 hypothetical protein NNL22_11885 [Alkalimarinus sediminis]
MYWFVTERIALLQWQLMTPIALLSLPKGQLLADKTAYLPLELWHDFFM